MAATLVLVEIGERLRRQRKKLKMTQEDTAELLEMSTTFYGEIERGNKRLSIEKILLVYERMGLDRSGDTPTGGPVWSLGAQLSEEKYLPAKEELEALKSQLNKELDKLL